uniref:Uncharacterized protein LOC105139032 isoform X2 n=1 Tax=Rhizophora mucronata TaxID=61149 RepID=A0A2P2PJZ7_RHIMU
MELPGLSMPPVQLWPTACSTATDLTISPFCNSVLACTVLLLAVSLNDISIFCNIEYKWDSLLPCTSKDSTSASKPSSESMSLH